MAGWGGHRIVAAGVAVLALVLACGLPLIDAQAGYAGLSPRFLPGLVSAGLALAAWRLWRGARSVLPQAPDAASAVQPEAAGRRLAWAAGGLIGHLLLVGTAGFVLAGTLLLVCVARGFGSTRPARDALVGLALTLPVWFVFARLLGVGLKLFPPAGL
jgi:putative tricarboxylic transport membrane protein